MENTKREVGHDGLDTIGSNTMFGGHVVLGSEVQQ